MYYTVINYKNGNKAYKAHKRKIDMLYWQFKRGAVEISRNDVLTNLSQKSVDYIENGAKERKIKIKGLKTVVSQRKTIDINTTLYIRLNVSTLTLEATTFNYTYSYNSQYLFICELDSQIAMKELDFIVFKVLQRKGLLYDYDRH